MSLLYYVISNLGLSVALLYQGRIRHYRRRRERCKHELSRPHNVDRLDIRQSPSSHRFYLKTRFGLRTARGPHAVRGVASFCGAIGSKTGIPQRGNIARGTADALSSGFLW